MSVMKLVIVESPYASHDPDVALTYLERCLLDCLSRGESPYASHKLLTNVLDDTNIVDRERGIDAGYAWYPSADQIVFYTDLGWSPGMIAAWKFAGRRRKIRIFRALDGAVTLPTGWPIEGDVE